MTLYRRENCLFQMDEFSSMVNLLPMSLGSTCHHSAYESMTYLRKKHTNGVA